MLRRHLQVALVTAIALGTTLPLQAADKKVPEQKKLEKLVASLYETDSNESAEREEIYLLIDKVLGKKKGNMAALAAPGFWAHSIHAGRFSKRRGETPKKVKEKKVEFELRNGGNGFATVAFHGAAKYSKKVSHPYLFVLLEEGQDAKAYVKNLVETRPELKAGWIVAAAAEDSKTFPVSKDPSVALPVIVHLTRSWFNVDSDRWFLEGSGKMSSVIQELACTLIPDRVAGVVLRNPTEAKASHNAAMTTAFVLHDEAGKAVAEAWNKLDETHNKSAVAGAEGEAAVLAWLLGHAGRKLPKSYSFETTMKKQPPHNPDWTGSLRVISPGEYDKRTQIDVDYDREKNTVSVAAENLSEFILYMNDELLDLDKEVSVSVNGEVQITKIFERRMRDMFETASILGEFGQVYPSSYRGTVKSNITEAAADSDKKEDGDKKEDDKKEDDGK